ncbi:activating signal cointegrator 1 complex subunit 1-like isoform X2 [Argiope bruennichi]|nr:activating signal cointegrator 1 complex subunit 1-like isoform X2 [Argiope bruennichi]XP_055933221.1 activating signal cointegrator 1 complex subunit 1-like isoform X2 [Argiope bruennichi]
MDILKPKLVWIEGRCYRQLPIRKTEIEHEEDEFIQPMKPQIRRDEDFEDTDLSVKHQGDKFFIVITIPKELIKFIIGSKGATKRQIEESTSSDLSIPDKKEIKDNDEADISITGKSVSSVVRAYHRIENIVEDVRWRVMEYTHFISIPMNDENIIEKYLKFKDDVLRTCRGSTGISEQIFISPAELHLTIVMLTLLTKREKEEAAAILQKTRNEILQLLDRKPLQIEIKGVEYMNDEPEEVRILYGKVQEKENNNCLQIIANKLADTFSMSPLGRKEASDDPNNVKLHVTLMRGKPGVKGYREPFDASQILEKYANYSFGQTTVSQIHVSIRFTSGKDSYYKPFYVLEL